MVAIAEISTRRRILDATSVVLSRSGHRNLQLSDVAAEAKVSRPTLYRYFGSKAGLLEAFALYEQDNFDAGIAAAIAGFRGEDRLDAALQFIVAYQNALSSVPILAIEPDHVLVHMHRMLPLMRERIRRVISGEHADIAAAAVVRIAVCHYLVQGDGGKDGAEDFLAELRLAAGLDPARRRAPRAATAS